MRTTTCNKLREELYNMEVKYCNTREETYIILDEDHNIEDIGQEKIRELKQRPGPGSSLVWRIY
jgi:hypothetical protein